jgi:hypothetical protein
MIRIYRDQASALRRRAQLARQYPNKQFRVFKREFGHAVYIVVAKGLIPCA